MAEVLCELGMEQRSLNDFDLSGNHGDDFDGRDAIGMGPESDFLTEEDCLETSQSVQAILDNSEGNTFVVLWSFHRSVTC